MLRRHLAALFALFVVLSASVAAIPAAGAVQSGADCSFPYNATDATGTEVTVDGEPERIVVLQASAAQTAWELDAQDRVVGAPVNPTTSYLDGIESKEDILNEDQFTVNQEAVVELSADLVLAPNIIPDETVASLRDADQTVYKFGFGTSLEFIAEKTTRTGRLIGGCDAAESTNEEYNDDIESVGDQTDEYESPRVMYFTDNFTAGSGTFIDSLITTAGGTNVAAENGVQNYGQINEEALVEWNPEVIVVSGVEGGVPDTEAYESTFAVQNDQVVTVDANYVSQPGPRVVVPLQTMADAFATAETEPTSSPPEITEYEVTADGDEITVTFQSNESLADIEVAVEGPNSTTLDREDFSGDRFEGYEATVEVDEDGEYTLELVTAADTSSNDGAAGGTYFETVAVEGTESDANGSTGSTATPTAGNVTSAGATATATEKPVTPTDETRTDAADDSAEPTATTDDSSGTTATDADGPGLGVVTALVALLSLALLARRR